MKKKMLTFLKHLVLFVIIELLFVLIIFHEIPSFSIFSIIGIVHISYFIIVVVTGIIREKIHSLIGRFLCTYGPIVFHIAGHIYVGYVTIEEETKNSDEVSILWAIIGTIIAGVLIFVGEYLLHRKNHCDSHHGKFHHEHCEK